MNDPRLAGEIAAREAEQAAAEDAAAAALGDRTTAQQRVLLHMPVDVRSLSMAVVAVLAGIFALQWAKPIVVPLLLGLMFSYALTPVVDRLQRWHLPRAAGAGLLLSAILCLLAWGAWSLSDDASAVIETLPAAAQKLRESLQRQRQSPVDTLARMQEAAAEIERAAEEQANPGVAPAAGSGAAGASAAASGAARGAPAPALRPPTRVVVEKPGLNIRDYLLTGTIGALAILGQTMIVFLITFFLLASGNTFRRKMVKLAGPRLSQKKITVQALDEITEQIQTYLLVQLGTSVIVGVATWLAFLTLGLDRAAVWGVAAALTNLIPYVGATILGAGSALAAFIQFGAVDMALTVSAASFAIHALVGNLLTPYWTGRASRMSPLAVFVSVLAFGWLWGAVGLILGVPILMVVKAICDRVDELKPIGELLGA